MPIVSPDTSSLADIEKGAVLSAATFFIDFFESLLVAGAHVAYIMCMFISLVMLVISFQEINNQSLFTNAAGAILVGIVFLFNFIQKHMGENGTAALVTTYGVVSLIFLGIKQLYRLFRKNSTHTFSFRERLIRKSLEMTAWFAIILLLLMLGSALHGMLWHDIGIYGTVMVILLVVSLCSHAYIEGIHSAASALERVYGSRSPSLRN